jgi:hypothetical protein
MAADGGHVVHSIHLALGAVATAAGLTLLLLPKGDLRHKSIGVGYLIALIGLNVTAWMNPARDAAHSDVFHSVTALGAACALVGFAAAAVGMPPRRWRDLHYVAMSVSYLALLTAGGAAGLARIAAWNPIAATLASFAVMTALGSPIVIRSRLRNWGGKRLSRTAVQG